MTTRIKLRRDTSANWEIANPILALGEPGVDLTENKLKIGDGITAWLDLPFLTDAVANSFALADLTGVAITNPVTGEILKFDGTSWINGTVDHIVNNGSDTSVTANTDRVVVAVEGEGVTNYTFGTGGRIDLSGDGLGSPSINSPDSFNVVAVNAATLIRDNQNPAPGKTTNSSVGVYEDGVEINASRYTLENGFVRSWQFKTDGNLQLPVDGHIVNSNGENILAGLGGGGNANTGDFTFDGNYVTTGTDNNLNIVAIDNDENEKVRIKLDPTVPSVELKTKFVDSYTFTSGWDSAVWTNTGGSGRLRFENATELEAFTYRYLQRGEDVKISVNGSPLTAKTGAGTSPGFIDFYIALLPETDPTTITEISFEFFNPAYIIMDMDNGMIELDGGADLDINLRTQTSLNLRAGDKNVILDTNTGLRADTNIATTAHHYQDASDGSSSYRVKNMGNGPDPSEILRAYNGDPEDGSGNDVERASIAVTWQTPDQSGLRIRSFDQGFGAVEFHDWNFGGDGVLTFPDGTTQSTAATNTGSTTYEPLPDWLLEVPGTHHLPTKGVDYGWDENGFWTVNATIRNSYPEGTSYPIRSNFTIPANVKTIVTVDFTNSFNPNGENYSDFGVAFFRDNVDPIWMWDGTSGDPDANRIGAQYDGTWPELHGIAGGAQHTYELPSEGTYTLRFTTDPTDGVHNVITMETLDATTGDVLNTITYNDNLFDGPYKVGFASDQDDGSPRVYMRNLTIEVVGVETYSSDLSFAQLSAGDITLPLTSTIKDVANGVEITVKRGSTEWYSVYADLAAPNNANATVAGSVVHDSEGSVYVLGSISDQNDFSGNNLFLKYNTRGGIQWSRTWTDQNGMFCGSYNTSARYLPPTTGVSNRELIYWSSYEPPFNRAYVGSMDTDGTLVDGYGNGRAPVQIDNCRIADLEVQVNGSIVGVGSRSPNGSYRIPFIANVNPDNYTINSAITVQPPYININNTNSFTNFFKSAVTVGNVVMAVGNYDNGNFEYDWPILTTANVANVADVHTYHLTSTNPSSEIWAEDIAHDSTTGNAYVILNGVSDGPSFGVVGRLDPDNLSEYTWMRRLGDGMSVYLLALDTDAAGDIYILGETFTGNYDLLLFKLDSSGTVLWQRRIGSPEFEGDGTEAFASAGYNSSSSISVHGDHVTITAMSLGVGSNHLGAFTVNYLRDGSLLGQFDNYYIEEVDVGIVNDWLDTINDLTDSTSVNVITTDSDLVQDVRSARLTATLKTLESGFQDFTWDLTNNQASGTDKTWQFNHYGSLILPSGGIHFPSGASITEKTLVETINSNFAARQALVIDVEQDLVINTGEDSNSFRFKQNGGVQFADGTTQYGAYIADEVMIDGGSAITTFPLYLTTPRAVDGGGSASRFGYTDPAYDGSNNGANINPNDFDILINGGGA